MTCPTVLKQVERWQSRAHALQQQLDALADVQAELEEARAIKQQQQAMKQQEEAAKSRATSLDCDAVVDRGSSADQKMMFASQQKVQSHAAGTNSKP